MEIIQSFVVQHSPDRVWDALSDAPFAVQCLPGAQLDEESEDRRHYKGSMQVRLGPLAASFVGDATVDRDEDNKIGRIEWSGVDKRSNSRVRAKLKYEVIPAENSSSKVSVEAQIALTGALAQFGRGGIVNDVASRLTQIFADRLQQRLTEAVEDGQEEVHETNRVRNQEKSNMRENQEAELRPLSILFSVFKERIANFFRKITGR